MTIKFAVAIEFVPFVVPSASENKVRALKLSCLIITNIGVRYENKVIEIKRKIKYKIDMYM